MRQRSKEQQEEYQQTMQWAVKRRWVLTIIHLLLIGGLVQQMIVKRMQWHLLFSYPPAPGITLGQDILTCLLLSVALIELWLRIHRFRREQQAATPAVRVWPPPQSPV